MKLFDIGFLTITINDLLDIGIVTYIIYKVYNLLRGSLVLRVIGLVLSLFFLGKLVSLLQLTMLTTILESFLNLGALALVIIFAPEIRRFLTSISKDTLVDKLIRQINPNMEEDASPAEEILASLKSVKSSGVGALIVILGNDLLAEIQETGDQLDAQVSSRLIIAIFQKQSPLHDGAMLVYHDRIAAVRCILPISQRADLAPELGIRHRAGLGMSEQSDALIIIVSEERREVAIANKGVLERDASFERVEEAIDEHIQRLKG